MSKKSGNFFERHIEKIVLAIVGVICIWLLITRVLISSSSVKLGSDKVGPGEIDVRINAQANRLREKLQEPPTAVEPPEAQVGRYKELVASAIDISSGVCYPIPSAATKLAGAESKYGVPEIGVVSEVAARLISGVAYVPAGEVGQQISYFEGGTKLADLDLVTVEGSLDTAELYGRFSESFAGDGEDESHYARPVFAAVQLQRQKMRSDGSWPGDDGWEKVPRAKNGRLREMFEIPERVDELSWGETVEILMIRFDQPNVKIVLLQPEPYNFYIPVDSWLPPRLATEREKRLEEQRAEEQRERREQKRAEEERERRERSRSRGAGRGGVAGRGLGSRRFETPSTDRTRRSVAEQPGRRASRSGERGGGVEPGIGFRRLSSGAGLPGQTGDYGTRRTTGSRSKEEETEYVKIKVTTETDISRLQKLVFWAHDDTAQPGSTYLYRIRIGVFNPIAGTDQFSQKDEAFKGDVVLWSDFSEVTEAIRIPGRLYFFPQKVARQADKSVTVEVSKKLLGKWYSEGFIVRPGEVIGQVKDLSETDGAQKRVRTDDLSPTSVDYRTGAMLVDVVDVSDWGGTSVLRPRNYSDMLYTADGENIEHLPIKESYWPEELRAKFKQIKEHQKKQEEVSLVGVRRRPEQAAPGPRRRLGGPGMRRIP